MGYIVFYVSIFCLFKLCFCLELTNQDKLELITESNKPKNLTVLDVDSTSIKLGWSAPENTKDVKGYHVHFKETDPSFNSSPQERTFEANSSVNYVYNLKDLNPLTKYKIWINAFTDKDKGEPSDSVENSTDVAGPNPPVLLNITCESEDRILIKWKGNHFPSTGDRYYIYLNKSNDWNNVTVEKVDTDENFYVLKNVSSDAVYTVYLQASTLSSKTGKLVWGNVSEPKSISMPSHCDKVQEKLELGAQGFSSGILAGILCATFAFFLAISSYILWRKCFHSMYYYLDDPPGPIPTASLDWNAAPTGSTDYKGAIPVHAFAKHVADLHVDGDIGFSKEYESIQSEAANEGQTSEYSQHPENRVKNRYLNIIAYDHSRVQLLPMPGQKKHTDYINANYIDGFQWSKAYIGTQGPLPSTFDCFWRMIWEQRVSIIVMITNLVERGRRKCDMYWPKEGTETYGFIQVRLVKEDVMATYTVRTLQIKHLRVKKRKIAMAEKMVYQYHYTNWPDHGTPDHPLPVLHFVIKSAAANPPDGGPIVVHCSAGVGRTGTYIVLDAMLRQIRLRSEVNIYGFLRHIRSQRNFLVQTEEQYIFIHDALLEAIESGTTSISKEQFPLYVRTLENPETEEKNDLWRTLEVQFKLVTSFQSKDFNVVSANKTVNQPKNRNIEIIPIESSRVHLTPKPGEDGSDYINASWMQGFSSLREFIITQHPLSVTIKDFWQMVWDHNVHNIIMLSSVDNEEFETFWPPEGEVITAQSFKVKLIKEDSESFYIIRNFLMQSVQDDYEILVKMVQYSNWLIDISSGVSKISDMPQIILKSENLKGPTIVIDRYGGTEAASFCLLSTIKRHLDYDNQADVYMYSKLYHNRRPGIWTSVSDYLQLHHAVLTLCEHTDIKETDLLSAPNGNINGSISNEFKTHSDQVRVD